MFKRVMIGLFAMSVVMVLWTEANAGCVAFGGSLFCADWLTGSVKCKVKTTRPKCTFHPEQCEVSCTATNTHFPKGFAFCQKDYGYKDYGYKVTRRACNIPFSLSSDVSHFDSEDCEFHNGHKVCKKTLQLFPRAPEGCNTCCNDGETCVDFTPKAMDTTATIDIDRGYEDSALVRSDSSKDDDWGDKDDDWGDKDDDDEDFEHCSGSSCTLEQRCTINPDKIQYLKSRPYACQVTSVSGE
jgi:hypothetical protein